jgi:hypothetical protein
MFFCINLPKKDSLSSAVGKCEVKNLCFLTTNITGVLHLLASGKTIF